MRYLCFLLILTAANAADPGPRRVIAVDGWHNNEKQPHYRWDGAYMGGFSKLGALLKGLGGELRTITESISPANLKGIDCLIAVDPDTPAETASPQYWTASEIAAVDQWVKAGGTLVLLGNDKGNAEFEHFNELATKFGVTFVEGKHATAAGVTKLRLKGPANPVFEGTLEFYAVDVAPLKITHAKPEVLLSESSVPLMAILKHGKGAVFALGDPWLYDEYIASADNTRIGENLFRYLLWTKR
jgi:unsaturated rhamnogalacturonyl hydrolase